MNVVGLLSGGKDSCYSLQKCVNHGHRIAALANLYPSKDEQKDSFMYQTQGWEVLPAIAECMGVPLVRRAIRGMSLDRALVYSGTEKEDEVEDLYELLKEVKERFPVIDAVCCGAILSTYQRTRVENVCERLGLTSLAFLWNRDQVGLLKEMVEEKVGAVLVKVCSFGLNASHLGKSIAELAGYFEKIEKEFGFHACGEGGEYETLTLDCPLFVKGRIVLDETRVVVLEDRAFSPIAVFDIIKFHIEAKPQHVHLERKVSKPARVFRDGGVLERKLSQDLSSVQTQLVRFERNNIFVLGPFFAKKGEAYANALAPLRECAAQVGFVHLYMSDLSEFQLANDAFESIFFGETPPSRATVEMNGLGEDVAFVVTAVLSKSPKKVLLVRSISEWAPMCIGPYAQCNVLNDRVALVSGQIALDPLTMKIHVSSLSEQLELCARHSRNVLIDRQIVANPEFPATTLGAIIYISATELDGVSVSDCLKIMTETMVSLNDSSDFDYRLAKFTNILVVFVSRLPRNARCEIETTASVFRSLPEMDEVAPRVRIDDTSFDGAEDWTRVFFNRRHQPITKKTHDCTYIPVDSLANWDLKTKTFVLSAQMTYTVLF